MLPGGEDAHSDDLIGHFESNDKGSKPDMKTENSVAFIHAGYL